MPSTGLDTHQKALAVNLDPSTFGSFAEIGAGQEVARWFLRVGAASGTVAKTVSAYDKEVSDDLYGVGTRYVSLERLEAMLDREWEQLLAQLQESRGKSTRFFSFANTVAARNFSGTNECHGWMGIRFQAQPGSAPDTILLHINLKDPSNLLQQEVVGIVGVNLIYAVFHQRESQENLLKTLIEETSLGRIEIDYIEALGPSFQDWNREELLLALVLEGLAETVVFPSGNQRRPPTEVLRKRPIVLTPLVSERIEPAQREMLSAAILKLKTEAGDAAREPLGLFAISTSPPELALAPPEPLDLLRSVEALRALGNDVLIFSYREFYRMTSFVNRYTHAPVRFVVGVSALIHLFSAAHGDLEGRLLEGLAKLFAQNVCVYAYPTSPVVVQQSLPAVSATDWEWELNEGLISVDQLHASPPLGHLLAYVLASKFIVPLQPKLQSKGIRPSAQ